MHVIADSRKQELLDLKERLRIPDVWVRMGLPGAPSKSCRSPFREDRSPSFSIYHDGRRWKDFSTGEGGDVIDFVARALGVNLDDATRIFLRMSGRPLSAAPRRAAPPVVPSLTIPRVRRGTPDEIAAIERSRHLSPGTVDCAMRLGVVAFGKVCGHPSWILSDCARKVAEARRVDGHPYPAFEGGAERKAHTLRGSSKAWPVGVAVLARNPNFRAIMMMEGGPDHLSALDLALQHGGDLLPIAMLGRGAGTRIDPDAIALLAGRRVRIYPHNDADGGGMRSAHLWAEQLHVAGCKVDFANFAELIRADGRPVKDLNDALPVQGSQKKLITQLIP